MELQLAVRTQFLHSPQRARASLWRNKPSNSMVSSSRLQLFCPPSLSLSLFTSPFLVGSLRKSGLNASKVEELLKFRDGNDDDGDDDEGSESDTDEMEGEDSFLMDEEERLDWRRKIRKVMDMRPEVEEEVDPVEKKRRMEKLLADYPLVMDEEDPDWPEDADGRGFKLDQFFDKIRIKNVKKDNDDDEDDDGKNEIVWQDDDYIRPIKDLTTAEWEEAVFKDFSPLIVLVHNRYRRPKENGKIRDELEKAIQIIWNCRIPSPRCVAVDAVVEHDLVSALKVSLFPELIFTKNGKILYREKALRTADELSKIMAFFYYGAAKPPFLNVTLNDEETIPTVQISNKTC